MPNNNPSFYFSLTLNLRIAMFNFFSFLRRTIPTSHRTIQLPSYPRQVHPRPLSPKMNPSTLSTPINSSRNTNHSHLFTIQLAKLASCYIYKTITPFLLHRPTYHLPSPVEHVFARSPKRQNGRWNFLHKETTRHSNFQTSRWLPSSSAAIWTWAQSARVSTFTSSAISSRIRGCTRSPGGTTWVQTATIYTSFDVDDDGTFPNVSG